MDIKDIIALANAGFSKDDIAKIAISVNAGSADPTPANVPAQTQTPANVPAQTPANVPANVPAQIPTQTPEATPVDAILKELGLIKDTMQANALLGAQMPKPESTDDILASIINPPVIEKK